MIINLNVQMKTQKMLMETITSCLDILPYYLTIPVIWWKWTFRTNCHRLSVLWKIPNKKIFCDWRKLVVSRSNSNMQSNMRANIVQLSDLNQIIEKSNKKHPADLIPLNYLLSSVLLLLLTSNGTPANLINDLLFSELYLNSPEYKKRQ